MNPLSNVVPFELPKRRPKVIEKEPAPDRRKFAVVPIKAIGDKRLHNLAIRILVCACSYANKAGITWVGQRKIAEDLQIHQSQVSRELAKLKELGYVDLMAKGFRGAKGDTIRIIYDSEIEASEAIAIASADTSEDLRPPEMRRKETKELEEISEEQARENQKRLASMLVNAFKRPAEANKHVYQPVKGDTMTVKKMKQEIAKAKRKQRIIDDTQVINDKKHIDDTHVIECKPVDNSIIDDIIDDMHVIRSTENNSKDKDIYKGFYYLKDICLNICCDDLNESNIRYLEMLDQVQATEAEMLAAVSDGKPKTLREICEYVVNAKA